jgi:hypothetical protein
LLAGSKVSAQIAPAKPAAIPATSTKAK